ncbi:unnamed protein product [Rotaria sp. Silwood1]|nr:unnamed protein product [Rotaria sp. Silwood1]CAF1629545.1 unnamed protein product [Rotaria sp. Silwood1]CAF3774592.1 unnamed protein product [Rotaria sp. Silwood1]CAF4999160.1 unnamed protein product [Rotaria sp. Silwood1]
MVLRHASERFRLAYEIPPEEDESFGVYAQFLNVTVDQLDENSYRSDILGKYDLWKKKQSNQNSDELYDYQDVNESFYDNDLDEDDTSDYHDDENSQSSSIYQWHRDQHFDIKNLITKYVDDKIINITVMDFVKNLPQINRNNYQANRLPFEMLRSYGYLIEEKYRGRSGRDGMIEFYIERTQSTDDLLSLDHLLSICRWEKAYKHILSLDNVQSLSLATFVALYSSKNDCQLITADDAEHFRSILHTCLPYYVNGYMDVPFSDKFLNRVSFERQPGFYTYQEQTKAVYTALRHTCFYKNITRFIFDHFVDKKFINEFQRSKNHTKLSISMIFISNYKIIKYNRTRDQTTCLRRQPYARKHCQERGCIDDYKNNLIDKSCANEELAFENCEKYCQCKHQCLNETEQVILLVPILREPQLIEIYIKQFSRKQQLSKYKDEFVKLIALNFAAVREKAAMVQVYEG